MRYQGEKLDYVVFAFIGAITVALMVWELTTHNRFHHIDPDVLEKAQAIEVGINNLFRAAAVSVDGGYACEYHELGPWPENRRWCLTDSEWDYDFAPCRGRSLLELSKCITVLTDLGVWPMHSEGAVEDANG